MCLLHYFYAYTITDAEADRAVSLEEVVCMLQCLDTQDWDGSVASVQHAIAALSQWIPASTATSTTGTINDGTTGDTEQVRMECQHEVHCAEAFVPSLIEMCCCRD
jgi:hypothetical protein